VADSPGRTDERRRNSTESSGTAPESSGATLTPGVAALPSTVPFVAPDAIERGRGSPLRLRLGANESAFGTSPHAQRAMRAAVERVAWYADPESFDLRARLAALHGVPMGNIVVGAGVDDLLGLVVRAFVAPGRNVVASYGSYPTFAYHVSGYGGALHHVPYQGDGFNDLEGLAALAHRVGATLVYLANPDNPTGTGYPAARVDAFLDALPPRSLLVLDEAYCEFAPERGRAAFDGDDARVIRMRTFSKLHGMAGARIGYAVTAKATVDAFEKIRLHFGVNLPAQAGALASLDDPEFQRHVIDEVDAGRRDYAELARGLGLSTLPSQTNFVAIDLGRSDLARAVRAELLARGVFVRMPMVAPIDRCIRVTVGTPPERALFAEVFREVLLASPESLRKTPGPW
jgi:histidinol-phosphate aminotransferase